MLRTVAVPEEHFTFSVAAASEAQKRLRSSCRGSACLPFLSLLLAPLSNIQTGRYDFFVPVYTMAMLLPIAGRYTLNWYAGKLFSSSVQ